MWASVPSILLSDIIPSALPACPWAYGSGLAQSLERGRASLPWPIFVGVITTASKLATPTSRGWEPREQTRRVSRTLSSVWCDARNFCARVIWRGFGLLAVSRFPWLHAAVL
eukprot:3595686-Pleurochrysis_carterae.AAC.1